MQSLWTELRKAPMLCLAAVASAGILVAFHVDFRTQFLLWLCVGLFGLAIASLISSKFPAVWIVATLLFFGTFAAYRATLALNRDVRARLTRICGTADSVSVTGRVYLPASDNPRQNSVTLSDCTVRWRSEEFSTGYGRLRVYGDSAGLGRLRYGDQVYAAGRLNSGRDLYGTRGALVSALVRGEVGTIYADSNSIFSERAGGISARRVVDAFRAYSRHVFGTLLSTDGAALCKALLLGDRGEFGPVFTNNLQITGLSHIFALSGMNTGLVILVVWIAISWLPIPHSARLWMLLGAVVLYMEVGREAPSLVRSSLAAGSMILGHLLHRRAVFLNLILAAMFLELLWKPLDIVDAGFLLSYLAVFGIVGAYTWLRRLLLQFWARPVTLVKTVANVTAGTVAAQVGTMPMVSYLFHRVPLAGVLGNLIVVPGFAFLLILAVLLLALHPLLPWLASLISGSIDSVAWALASVVNLSAKLPFASAAIAPFSPWILIVLCGSVLVVFVGIAVRRATWVALGVLIAANVLVWDGVLGSKSPRCEVTFVDVENGDATLISAGDCHVLVDAGPNYGFWSAAARIRSLLVERRIDRLDAVILTHPDNDHIGGAAELILAVPIDCIYDNGERGTSQSALEVDLAAVQQDVPVRTLFAGQKLNMAPAVTLTVLSPDSAHLYGGGANNEKSLVIRVDVEGSTMLLPADIDSSVELNLGAWRGNLDVDLIKSPHHGSRRSTTNAFLAMTTPEVCIISSGRRNPFGHPAPEVLARLAEHHVNVLNTAQEGTMTFVTRDGGWTRIPSEGAELAKEWQLDF